jgi:hypothetical protein
MRIAHYTISNGSGMHRVAESMAEAEKAIGLDSFVCDIAVDSESGRDVDIHVVHTHLPEHAVYGDKPIVHVSHGTPEYVFSSSVEAGRNGGYGHGDGWMLVQHWMQRSDAIVTFWPRHQKIWKSMCDKKTHVECIPLGIDKSFWHPVESYGKFTGTPSLLTAENCHTIKWPLDLFIAWPWVTERLPLARLHAVYVPYDQHRWWFPLVNRNGCSFSSFISPAVFSHEELRNALCSVDFYIGLVRYGDFNRVCLEAKACGCKVISYVGNPHADYWIAEGDQRNIAEELLSILRGQRNSRPTEKVHDASVTAEAMKEIYEKIA